jgi:predicted HTH transcriptional regulator
MIYCLLNSDGGTLLIGVEDKGNVIGIEDDFYENDDRHLLNFKKSS